MLAFGRTLIYVVEIEIEIELPTVQAGGVMQRLHSADYVDAEWLKTYGL